MPITSEELREILHEHAAAAPSDPVRRAQIHRRIRRAIGAGVATLAAVLAVALATGVLPGWRGDRTAVASGQTTATLVPSAVAGPPTRDQLDAARDQLLHRFATMRLPTRAITVNPDGSITVSIAAKVPADELRALVGPGALTTRVVVATADDHPPASPVTADPPAAAAPTLDQVRAKVGADSYQVADNLRRDPTDTLTLDTLAPFRSLTPAEVAVLPPTMQFYVPTISCAQLDARDPIYLTGDGRLDQQVVACGPGDSRSGRQKFLLHPSPIVPSDVVAADARYDLQNFGGWYVEAYLTDRGAHAWESITRAQIGDQIAELVDTAVICAPIPRSQLEPPINIFQVNATTAPRIAAVLDTGPLAVDLVVTDVGQ